MTLPLPAPQVFDQKSWEVLMSRSIVPKLALTLQRLVINPAAQVSDQHMTAGLRGFVDDVRALEAVCA